MSIMLDTDRILGIFANVWRYLFKIFDKLAEIDKRTKEILKIMATQEERLQSVAAAVGRVQAGVDNIQEQLKTLKEANPQIEDEISAIEASVAALGADVDSSVSPAPNA